MPSGATLPSQVNQSLKPVARKGKQVRNAPWVAKGEHARHTQGQAAVPARITCAFHEDGTYALYTVRPSARARRAFPQRFQLTGIHHHNQRESEDDAKPLHNRGRWSLRGGKNKNPRIFATFFRLGTPFRPFKAKMSQSSGGYLRFCVSSYDPRGSQQSLIAKILQSRPIFCFRTPRRPRTNAAARIGWS